MKLEADVRLKIFIGDDSLKQDHTVEEVERNIKKFIVDGKFIVKSVKLKLVKETDESRD